MALSLKKKAVSKARFCKPRFLRIKAGTARLISYDCPAPFAGKGISGANPGVIGLKL
jgi:hypothetical protein